MKSFQVAEALENALANQKGFVSYYFLDANPEWLEHLQKFRLIFREHLKNANETAQNDQDRQAIALIEKEYNTYIKAKDTVIALYQSGNKQSGIALHQQVRNAFFSILDRCEVYKANQSNKVEEARNTIRNRLKGLRFSYVMISMSVIALLCIMTFILTHQILRPIRVLTQKAERDRNAFTGKENELKALSLSVDWLIKDIDHKDNELEKNRENMNQAEKLAVVGKLAAGTAHSIRNPLTSVKMRLFSLNRSLPLTPSQQDDFNVISDEIRHIDSVVTNFLEFSRPPKLNIQPVNIHELAENTANLLKYRFNSYHVDFKMTVSQTLPDIDADPDQLQEIFVNIIVNACEAMPGGGLIIFKAEAENDQIFPCVVINIIDNGPGIPEHIQDKIFQPFFTTKKEGTGLGLSIVARIVSEHGGTIDLLSEEGSGSIFSIKLPVA
ncbi:MAG: histidine kinase [Candidatus Magnetomorum sp.]|nr:histidine kinase [Candidatus Magnetomorum sp.]